MTDPVNTVALATLVDHGHSYVLQPGGLSILMAHGLLNRDGDTYRLSTETELEDDPGSAGVNNARPAAVLAVIRSALEAAALPPVGEPVAVRELEWTEETTPREDGPPEPTGHLSADSILGEYCVTFDGSDTLYPWGAWAPSEAALGLYFEGPEGAKAACQTDFATRIRSALVASPLDPKKVEGLVDELLEASRKALIATGPEIKNKNEFVWERLSKARVAVLEGRRWYGRDALRAIRPTQGEAG